MRCIKELSISKLISNPSDIGPKAIYKRSPLNNIQRQDPGAGGGGTDYGGDTDGMATGGVPGK